ncbi:MAG TPA: hypothetical protein VI318_21330 [Baekduia sp.]
MFTLPRHRQLLTSGLAVAALAGAGVAGTTATALAGAGGTTPFIQHWSAYSGSKVGGYTVGDPIDVHYVDPSGQTTERQFCWSPVPIGQPACGAGSIAAPAQAGTQKVTAMLNKGKSVSTQFAVGPANTTLGTGTGAFTPPVPYTVNGAMSLYANANLSDPIAQVSVGQQLGGYYSPSKGVTQVYDYATNQPGFFPSALLTAPAASVKTYTKVVPLKSSQTKTYTLSLPAGFTPGNVKSTGTAIDYALYRGSAIGTGVGNAINKTGTGSHSAFLGATVLRSTYTSKAVSVTVRTGKLEGPLTLRIAANGTT